MIAPPDISTGNTFVNQARLVVFATSGILTYNCGIPSDFPLTGPQDGEYFRTDFYLAAVDTPIYKGVAVISDQFEGICGHERWAFAPKLGIVQIESLNDGGEMKLNPVCESFAQHQFSNPDHTIKRIM
jgi:hypothetical protein